jgi:hypothetical protein
MDLRTALRFAAAAAALALAMAFAGRTWAVDGVIEINQASVKAAGGFPFAINQSGSYRLTSNLDVTDVSARPPGTLPENTTAIVLKANDVTIDLNGFSIIGPTACGGSPVTCTPTGSGRGIDAESFVVIGTVVVNGTVRGMGKEGIILNEPSRVERVVARFNGGTGIFADAVTDCTAHKNGNRGIETRTATNCLAKENGDIGIIALTAFDCTAFTNGGSPQINASGIIGHNICSFGGLACP